jgi:hypothetical protein
MRAKQKQYMKIRKNFGMILEGSLAKSVIS